LLGGPPAPPGTGGQVQVHGVFDQFSRLSRAIGSTPVANELGAGIETSNWFEALHTQEKSEAVRACLDAVDNQTDDPRDRWLRILFAVADAGRLGCPDAYDLALEWSRRGAGWTSETDFNVAGRSYKPGAVSVGTLLAAGKAAGVDLSPWRDTTLARLQPAGIAPLGPAAVKPASTDGPRNQVPVEEARSISSAPVPVDGSSQAVDLAMVSQSAAATPPDVALYVPGNQQQCRRLLDEAVAADPRTFVSGDSNGPLVVLRIPKQEALPPDILWLGDLPGTSLALPPDIVERAEKVAWYRRGRNGGLVRIHAPRALAHDYLIQMRGRYGAAVLVSIARSPAIELDGTIRPIQGHDAETGLYFDRLIPLDVPEKVSHAEACAAAAQLLLPFSEYKLSDPKSAQSLLLAPTLTALRRPFLPAAPLFVASSSMPGTGKGKLMRSVSQLAFGTALVTLTWGGNGEEFEKRLASVMLQTPAALNIDNANGIMVSGDLLESLITEGAADIRPLGRSETIRVRNRSFLCLTGNNPIITGDMARRTLVLDVVPRSRPGA
jgi:Primase C terminal 2 (PriCT-2)